jgi:hypothetical protein
VTADEGDIGRGHMQRFQDVETRTPVILTTSQLLTTGLDAPTCRNVVLVRLVNPRAKEDITHLPPAQLAADILKKEQRIAEIMGNIQRLLKK